VSGAIAIDKIDVFDIYVCHQENGGARICTPRTFVLLRR
jgi:hypothetical protein